MRVRPRFQLILAAVALLGAFGAAAAQQAAPPSAASAPLTQRLPLDPAITTGRFANGLRYFIRTTKRPEKRAELRLVVDVGSIVEENDQLGLAHFVEHMAFNGTKHFPKQQIVTFLESLGMRFGPSVNASTTFDETVYMLQVPTEQLEVIDRSFLILEDWAHGQTFDPVEIDKERGVIKEEWRIRRGAGARIQDKQLPVLLKGSRYAERIPIGTPEIIDNFKHERLVQFYKDWYRPDLMTVIAVGDFDPAAVKKMIASHFESIPAAKAPKKRPAYSIPDQPGTLYAIATDPEIPTASIAVYHKFQAPDPTTVGAYRQQLVEQLFSGMLGARFAELAQKPDAPFVGASGGRSLFVGDKNVSTLSAAVKGDAIGKTLDVLFTEAERVARFGFTAGELERVRVNLMTAMDRALTEKGNTPAASIAAELVRHVTNAEPVPGIAYEHALFKRFLPAITLEEVNALAKGWVPDGNRVVAVSAPEKAGFKVPSQAELSSVMTAALGRSDITTYVDTVDDAPLLDPLPSPRPVTTAATREAFGVTEWQLGNGARVVLKPTNFREDEILLRASSYGGTSLASDADFIPATSATTVLGVGGLGRLSAVELRKKLTGKAASVSASFGFYEEMLAGSSSKKDLETMFQLIYLRFTQPRADAQAFATMQSNLRSSVAQQRSNPTFLFNEAVTAALRGDHLRTRLVTPETVAALNLEKSLAFYKDRFADASDFTFVFVGSFDVAAMKPLVERYLGSLPSTGRKETWKDNGIRYSTGVIEKRVDKGLEPQSRAAMFFTGAFEHTQEQRIAIRVLGEVLQARLQQALRENLGGTYGVTVNTSYAQIPVPEYAVSLNFSCAPERTDELLKAAMTQVETLKANGPTEKEIGDTREKMLRDLETNSKQNGYWVNQLLVRYQSGESLDTLFAMPDQYKKVTAKMVHDAAMRYLNPANRVTVTLFPEKK